jgi:hypothetical protein
LEEFASGPERHLVQLGWWMTRHNAICDLPVLKGNGIGIRKIRSFPAAHYRIAVALARAEREYSGWDPSDAVLATTDAGPLLPPDRPRVLATAVIFADVYDANADPVVLECMGSATPVLVNRHPGVAEYLGDDYPLYFDTPEEAAAKAVDFGAIEAAQRHLCTDEVSHRATSDAFLSAVRRSTVYARLR